LIVVVLQKRRVADPEAQRLENAAGMLTLAFQANDPAASAPVVIGLTLVTFILEDACSKGHHMAVFYFCFPGSLR